MRADRAESNPSVRSDGCHFCPLCADADVEIYLDGPERKLAASALGPSREDVSPGRILRCRNCRLGFRRTRPGDTELSQLYGELNNELYEAEAGGRSRTALRHLRIVRQYASGGRLLEVGCASGLFLSYAADAGWEVVGIEPSASACDKAKKILAGRGELIRATLQEADLPPSTFDVVTLWDVLEHVRDPGRFMRLCASLLKPGGRLFANVPDLDSLQARLFGSRWPLLLQEHLNYFNRGSLKLCGELAGLTWMGFGRRPASFSIGYALYRLAQHKIPGAAIFKRLAIHPAIGNAIISFPLGELYGVWERRIEELFRGEC